MRVTSGSAPESRRNFEGALPITGTHSRNALQFIRSASDSHSWRPVFSVLPWLTPLAFVIFVDRTNKDTLFPNNAPTDWCWIAPTMPDTEVHNVRVIVLTSTHRTLWHKRPVVCELVWIALPTVVMQRDSPDSNAASVDQTPLVQRCFTAAIVALIACTRQSIAFA